MDVSNNSTTDTGVRTGSGTPPKIYGEEKLIIIEPGGVVSIPDPPCCPFTVQFLVNGEVVLTTSCDKPMRRIAFLRPGRSGRYQVRRFKKTPQPYQVRRLKKPPQSSRRRSLPVGDGPRASKRA
jgi:hypothetical protein